MGITSRQLTLVNTGKKNRRLSISGTVGQHGAKEYRGIDIRHQYQDAQGAWHPTKKGIFLSKEELYALVTKLGFDPSDIDPTIVDFIDDNKVERIPILRFNG